MEYRDSCIAKHFMMDQTVDILQMLPIKESLWLGTRSATESLECFQKAAELRTFLGMTAVLVAPRYRSLCRMMLAARHVCKGGMLPKTRGQRIHAYVVG